MAIESWSEVSYIKLNRGDEIEIAKSHKDNRYHLVKGICGGLGMVVVDIDASSRDPNPLAGEAGTVGPIKCAGHLNMTSIGLRADCCPCVGAQR
jgi:hypothetical protein